MAVSKLVEPYVKVTERVRETPNLLNIDGTSNIGGVIVAPAGPRLSYVSGPKDFLEKYTEDGEIPRNASVSFINAYYLSFSAGLVLARAMNTTAVSGLYFTSTEEKETKLLLNSETESLWGIKIGDKYYFTDGSDKKFDNFLTTIKGLTDDENNAKYDAEAIKAIEGLKANAVYCEDFDDLADKLAEALSCKATYSETVSGIVISPAKDITPENLIELSAEVKLNNNDTKKAFKANPIKFKNNVALTEHHSLVLDFSKVNNGIKGNWAFTFGVMAYYHGAVDRSDYADYSLKLVRSIDDIVSSINGINGLAAECDGKDTDKNFTIKIDYSKGNEIALDGGDLDYGGVTKSYTPAEASSDWSAMQEMLFAIYPNQPYNSNIYKMVVTPDEDELFVISLFNGSETNNYTVSLSVDAIDQSGANAYIENLNAVDDTFTIVMPAKVDEKKMIDATPKITQVFSFGDSGLDLSASDSVTAKTNALYALEDQEMYDIEYLSSFGETNLQFIKNYVYVGKNNYWFTPVDIPYDRTNANSIKSYFLNVDLTSNAEGMGPFDKNTGLTGWMNYIACSSLYYQRVMANKQARSEFAPCFEITNGILDFTNPAFMLGESDRVKLLNFKAPVNFLKFDQQSNVYYLNDNWTHQSERNIVSEEQNRRIINKINKDVRRLLKRFKGRFNTSTTRNDVISLLSYYFDEVIMTQNYAPAEYNIICDETNNTDEIITANKLAVTVQVRLYNAIKYIDVLTDIFPIGVDFAA